MVGLLDSDGLPLDATDARPLGDTGVVAYSDVDFARRIRGLLPQGWFPLPPADGEAETAPVLQGILIGFGTVFSWIVQLFSQVKAQCRLQSAEGPFLELIAADYFGSGNFGRMTGESDTAYRNRIVGNIRVDRNTRAAVAASITQLTGLTPRIIEPWNSQDCGGWAAIDAAVAGGGVGYGTSGLRYGTLGGGQFFVEASTGTASAVTLRANIEQMKATGIIGWLKVVG